jgi:gamma-glutamylcyclotransferase (GGCT)/AIG2-like uncharacterized protein YtfP
MKLFVYGTLKQGRSNHRLMHGAKFLGKAYILGYQLHQCPAITPKEGGIVYGELYEVESSHVAMLDKFEGHNSHHPESSLYKRTEMKAYPKHNHEIEELGVACSVYVYNQPCDYPVNESGVY